MFRRLKVFRRDRTRRSEQGFTLLEILVALTILSVSLTTLFAIFSGGLMRANEAERRMQARLLATALLSGAGSERPLEIGARAGEEDGLVWRLEAAPFGSRADHDSWDYGVVELRATVEWQSGNNQRTLSLNTLRLLPKEAMP